MARFHDAVGYLLPGTHVDGVWTPTIVERVLTGEVLEALSSLQPDDNVNNDIRLQNRISVVADGYALENFMYIAYVSYNGAKWIVQSVRLQRPRLILSLGGVYHGQVPTSGVPTST